MMKFIKRDHIPTDRRPLGYWLETIQGPLRENMHAGIPDADYATTMATLERIAQNVGRDRPSTGRRRGHLPRRGHEPKRGLA